MAHRYKRQTFDEGQFTLLSGSLKHEVELVPGDLDLWVEWFSDGLVTVWLLFQSGKRIPYSQAASGSFNLKVRDVISLILEVNTKSSTIAASVLMKELAIKDKLDYTPVEIAVPKKAQMDLSALMSAEVRKQLTAMGIAAPGDTLEVEDEDNLEEEIPDEFGPGYMEDEEPLVTLPRRSKSRAKSDPPSDNAASGDTPPSDPEPGGGPAPA